MSIGHYTLAEPTLAQVSLQEGGKKAPPKRTATAIADQKLVPEPR